MSFEEEQMQKAMKVLQVHLILSFQFFIESLEEMEISLK